MRIDEIFGPTIQGEGAQAGSVTMFVRTGGCDYRCSWCDTMHAVDEANVANWKDMSPDDIVDELRRIAPEHGKGTWVTISGGNPAIWQGELPLLVQTLHRCGYQVNIETQGSVTNAAFRFADMVTFSPKGPSSKMRLNREKLKACVDQAGIRGVLKFVVADREDFEWAKDVAKDYDRQAIYVQPLTVGPTENRQYQGYTSLCQEVAADPELRRWRVIPQLHVLAWGGERGR
jgi:7-carboxy-7-deazaguanine synthase